MAELYLKRWTIENAFQEIVQALRSEIDTLGYPGAALLGFSIAVLTYNALSVAKWAIEREHSDSIQREQLSGYYLAGAMAADYGGMMIALPEKEWTDRFASLTPQQFAAHLRTCARHVRPDTFRKNVRGPKRPRPKRSSGAINHYVSTARLIAELKITASQGLVHKRSAMHILAGNDLVMVHFVSLIQPTTCAFGLHRPIGPPIIRCGCVEHFHCPRGVADATAVAQHG